MNQRGTKLFPRLSAVLPYGDKIVGVLLLVLLGLLRPDLVVFGVYGFLYVYLYVTKRSNALPALHLALGVSIVYLFFAQDYYGYNQDTLRLFGLNVFTLFAWTCGLFATYLIYYHWEKSLKTKSFIGKFLFYCLLCWTCLIFVEVIAFHLLDIRNVATESYEGLPFCDCIHGPVWMQVMYFLLGPIYFCLWQFFRLRDPHTRPVSV